MAGALGEGREGKGREGKGEGGEGKGKGGEGSTMCPYFSRCLLATLISSLLNKIVQKIIWLCFLFTQCIYKKHVLYIHSSKCLCIVYIGVHSCQERAQYGQIPACQERLPNVYGDENLWMDGYQTQQHNTVRVIRKILRRRPCQNVLPGVLCVTQGHRVTY